MVSSPTFKFEQLTPSASPISLSLDDSNNPFQHLLASPTKIKLSESVSTSGFYPTSLSKLNDFSRGRGRSIIKNDSHYNDFSLNDHGKINNSSNINESSNNHNNNINSIRSNSPIRFNILNNSKPKMFKKEFISQPNSSLPLLSTLLRVASSGGTNTNNNSGNNKGPVISTSASTTTNNKTTDEELQKLSIRETMERIQQQLQREQSQDIPCINTKNQPQRIPSDDSTACDNIITENKNSTLFDSINKTDTSKIEPSDISLELSSTIEMPKRGNTKVTTDDEIVAIPLDLDMENTTDNNNNDNKKDSKDRVVSNTSTVFSSEINPNDGISLEHYATDKNGFVDYIRNNPNGGQKNIPSNMAMNIPVITSIKNVNNSNRYSFISSTSTDYDALELFEHQGHLPSLSSRSVRQYSSSSINDCSARLESSKLDLKIKQLEVEIGELKLQNAQLINSISTNKLLEDKLLVDMIQNMEHNTSKNSDEISHELYTMNNIDHNNENEEEEEEETDDTDEEILLKEKLKRLEQKFDNYKKTLDKLYDDKKSEKKERHNNRQNRRSHRNSRISRISSEELQKFENATDPSLSFTSSFSSDEDVEGLGLEDEMDKYRTRGRNGRGKAKAFYRSRRILEHEYEADVEDDNSHSHHYSDNNNYNTKSATEYHGSTFMPRRRGFNLNIPIEK